jgi:hypothetical protein
MTHHLVAYLFVFAGAVGITAVVVVAIMDACRSRKR